MLAESPDTKKQRLLAEYTQAKNFYSWAVKELSHQRGIVSHEDYQKILTMTIEASEDCDKRRRAYFNTAKSL